MWAYLTRFVGVLAVSLSVTGNVFAATGQSQLDWKRDLTPAEFEAAAKGNKLILLNLEAIWCHWCHVMEEKTYSNSKVAELLQKNYILVKVDQDSRPDLSNRYQDYGWPATIVMNAKGEDLRKFAGFVDPQEFATALDETYKNPKPEIVKPPVYQLESALTSDTRNALLDKLNAALDREAGGLKTAHKYLEIDTAEYLLRRAAKDDVQAREQIDLTLTQNENLFDSAWGGVYQYSTYGKWTNPHYEKLTTNQAENIRIYTLASRLAADSSKSSRYLEDAKKIQKYMDDFLKSPEGAFYTSQDADLVQGKESKEYRALSDADRRAKGIPRIDKNIYSDQNGRMIRALTSLYRTTGDEKYLNEAVAAANYIIKNRRLSSGGFAHGENTKVGPYLTDNLYMGIGILELYAVTGDRSWFKLAAETGDFITATFSKKDKPGLSTSAAAIAGVLENKPDLAENIDAVRFFNMLSRYSGEEKYKDVAKLAMRYLATPEVATDSLTEIGIVIADEELAGEPSHITVVAAKADPNGKSLYQGATRVAAPYLRTEWWDKTEGPMPNPDVKYPSLGKAAAFVCSDRRCSLPIFKSEDITRILKQFGSQQ